VKLQNKQPADLDLRGTFVTENLFLKFKFSTWKIMTFDVEVDTLLVYLWKQFADSANHYISFIPPFYSVLPIPLYHLILNDFSLSALATIASLTGIAVGLS
jgi:hypothetical protein